MNSLYKRIAHLPTRGGFGLVELLVSISIMVLVTVVVLSSNDSFSRSSLMRSQAYEIAFRLREVQLSAVGAQGGAADFRSLYGVQFKKGIDLSDPLYNQYKTFSTPDTTTSGWEGSITQVGPMGVIDKRFQIIEIETVDSGGTATPIDEALIVFARPNFDALFYNGSGTALPVEQIVITIGLRGAVGAARQTRNERTVIITATGQISVQ